MMFWRKWFKKKNREVSSLTVGVRITQCKECSKLNIGTEIHNLFSWRTNGLRIIGYDKETEEILLAEEQIMRIIQMVNPVQQPRKIRLVSQDELWGRGGDT